jgi:hypothetical protein
METPSAMSENGGDSNIALPNQCRSTVIEQGLHAWPDYCGFEIPKDISLLIETGTGGQGLAPRRRLRRLPVPSIDDIARQQQQDLRLNNPPLELGSSSKIQVLCS